MIVTRVAPALYVRTPFYRVGYDKVWRLAVGRPLTATSNGTVDFISERLVPTSTPQTLGGAFDKSQDILRNGSDEPPTIIGDSTNLGGNHKVGGRSTAVYYKSRVEMDGALLSNKTCSYVAEKLVISESYGIPTAASLAASPPKNIPLRCSIENTFSFDMTGFCETRHKLTCIRPMTLNLLRGVQAFKPKLKAGQTLHLIVPGSTALAGGVDITSESTERYILANDFIDAAKPPSHFVQEVRQSGVGQFAHMISILSTNRGTLTAAAYRSGAGKFYPYAYEGPTSLTPGMTVEVRLRHGCYGI